MAPDREKDKTVPPDAPNREALSESPEKVGKGPGPVGMEGPDEVAREPERASDGTWVMEGEPGREWGPEVEPETVEQVTRRERADED